MDIYDPAAPSIHGDIPNTWFISNNIPDALGRSDGRVLDSDDDGFTNEEEFAAKTCPSAANSYPDLVQPSNANPKLEVLKTVVTSATLTVDNMFGMSATTPETANIRVFDKDAPAGRPVKELKPGDSFDLLTGKNAGGNGRYTVVRFDKAEFSSFSGMVKENVVVIRDNTTASPNKEFTIRAGSKTAPGTRDYDTPNEKGRRLSDTTVTLRATAGSKKGETVSVQPGASFIIPGGKADGAELKATLEFTNENGSVEIKLDGAESPVTVPKASAKK